MLPHSVLISIMALIVASGNYCLMCLSPSLFALQGQRNWQMEMLNFGWRNQYVNEWVNEERVSYFLLAAAFLSCSLSPRRPSKFGVRVIISVQHRVKALLCPMIYSEAVAAKLQAIYTYSLFHEGWRWIPPSLSSPWGMASWLVTTTACSEAWLHLLCDLEGPDPVCHIPWRPGAVGSWMKEAALGDERVDSSSWPKRSLKFITNLVPHPNRHLLNVLGWVSE